MVKQTLLAKLSDCGAVICIGCVGFVGLPLVPRFAAVVYRVIEIDVDPSQVARLQKGRGVTFSTFPLCRSLPPEASVSKRRSILRAPLRTMR